MRKDVEKELRKFKIKLKEIRFREIGFWLRDKHKNEKLDKNLKLEVKRYKASKGEEYFLQFINKDNILFGLLRLRIVEGKAFIRELHIYGKALGIGKRSRKSIQHKGFGKKLMRKAEEIVKRKQIKEIKVISGVGVREYYKKLGYKLEKQHMVKKITN